MVKLFHFRTGSRLLCALLGHGQLHLGNLMGLPGFNFKQPPSGVKRSRRWLSGYGSHVMLYCVLTLRIESQASSLNNRRLADKNVFTFTRNMWLSMWNLVSKPFWHRAEAHPYGVFPLSLTVLTSRAEHTTQKITEKICQEGLM